MACMQRLNFGWSVFDEQSSRYIHMTKTGPDSQREVDWEGEGIGPAEAAARMKARRKALGNTQEITAVCPHLRLTLKYEGSIKFH